jgi:hypothetical protein
MKYGIGEFAKERMGSLESTLLHYSSELGFIDLLRLSLTQVLM